MPHWLLKAAVQRGIACLPRNYFWNELFQQHVTRSGILNADQVRTKLADCRRHLDNYRAYAERRSPAAVLELGTGRYPILPVGFALCGAESVLTFDIHPLLRPGSVAATLRLFLDFAETGRLIELLPNVRPDLLAEMDGCLRSQPLPADADLLARFGICVKVGDVCDSGLPAASIDFVMSNTTLQYISRDMLRRIFLEFRRVAAPGAVMSHLINMEDHFFAFDPSITPFNYLKYSSETWRWINNALISQNRLRLSDYRRIHEETGFEILYEQNTEGGPRDLDRIRLAPEFRHYAREDLLVLRTFIVSRPRPGTEGDRAWRVSPSPRGRDRRSDRGGPGHPR